MRPLRVIVLTSVLAATSFAQSIVFDQSLDTARTARPSQLWIDPSGENDLDSDAIAWEDFTLAHASTVTRVRFWGQVAPSLGFRIRFYNQDPNTFAMQPDLFHPGSGPILSETHEQVTRIGSSGSWQHYEIVLNNPIELAADTRYFLSVVGRTPIPWATWLWAGGGGVQTGTFYWSRGDTNTYRMMPENRAMSIVTDLCDADLNGDGVLNFFDVQAFLSAFSAQQPTADWAPPMGTFDFFDVSAFLNAFTAGCP